MKAWPVPVVDDPARRNETRLERLIDRLPPRMRRVVRWLRLPGARWVRIPVGILLIAGGLLSILPFLGLWMLPLGLVLLAEDVPVLRRGRDRILDWVARHRPHWVREASARPRVEEGEPWSG